MQILVQKLSLFGEDYLSHDPNFYVKFLFLFVCFYAHSLSLYLCVHRCKFQFYLCEKFVEGADPTPVSRISVCILSFSVADPDPGSGIRDWVLFDPWIRDPGSGIGFFRILDPGSRIPDPGSQDHIFKSFLTIFLVKSSIIL